MDNNSGMASPGGVSYPSADPRNVYSMVPQFSGGSGFSGMGSYSSGGNGPAFSFPDIFSKPASEDPGVSRSVPNYGGAAGNVVTLPGNTVSKPTFWEGLKSGVMRPEGEGGGFDFGAIGGLLDGAASIGSLVAGFQANSIAKDSLAFQKSSFSKNFANQLSSYNTALEDRANARAAQNNRSQTFADEYIAQHRLVG